MRQGSADLNEIDRERRRPDNGGVSNGTPSRYHHGNLPATLKEAAAELIAERGAAGFSLREVSRRAGVSHAAPAHHFGDSRGLLTELAIDAFRCLVTALAAAEGRTQDPTERLTALAKAYLEVTQTFGAQCTIMFRSDLVDTEHPTYQEWGDQALVHLKSALELVRDAYNPNLDVAMAASLSWSAMQGLVVLAPNLQTLDLGNRPGEPPPTLDEIATGFVHLLLEGFKACP